VASSLVGVIIIIPVPFSYLKLALSNNSMVGIKNARVFPEPVFAAPSISLPLRI
jgi:hypothetical protein